ncbi:MAG TPA: hypothetical protein VF297_05050 [Pyrinomonadaceae bacterium]
MKAYVEHLLAEHLDEIVSRSLLHCHAPNLHSVVLLDVPEKRVRLFVAETGHTLWSNGPEVLRDGGPLSIAFHPHHCNITLCAVAGEVRNWRARPDSARAKFELDRFNYNSAITGKGADFRRVGRDGFLTRCVETVRAGESVRMAADEIHTVQVARGKSAAWLVFEGREDPKYLPYAWSNADLEAETFGGLYCKASEGDVRTLLRAAHLT